MTTPKISIIIPVYNTEKYLDACIDSLVNQTFKDCEFIFINDGSIDSSSEILNKLASKDTRVIVINQDNQGVSIARNNGLKIARGKYIGFVDADDWVENDMYQILYDEIEFSYTDLVMCNSKCYQNGDFYVSGFKFPQNKILDINFIILSVPLRPPGSTKWRIIIFFGPTCLYISRVAAWFIST